MLTVRIAGVRSRATLKEIEGFLGKERLYVKGTDPDCYTDFRDRASADLAVVNLNTVPGVKAHILGD